MSQSPTKSHFHSIHTNNDTRANSHVSRTIRRFQSAHALSSTANSHTSSSNSHQRSQPPLPRLPINLAHRDPVKQQPSQQLSFAQRTRSNSDVATRRPVSGRKVAPPLASSRTRPLTVDVLLRDGPPAGDLQKGLQELREDVLTNGIHSDADGMSKSRIYVWLILINAPLVPTTTYLDLVHRGASPSYAKIRNDTFRTLATDPLFRRHVVESKLIRVLNAVAWKLHDAKEETSGELSQGARHTSASSRPRSATTGSSDAGFREAGTYVQGMNVLAAPFLYAAHSEVEAFAAFHPFLTRECPGYVRGAMDGVHRGVALVDKILSIVDTKLMTFLHSKGLKAEIYAFPSVLTLCACTPPLPEVLQLWDFLIAFGVHLNVVCVVAQLILMRNELMNCSSPVRLLRSFPPLQALKIRDLAVGLVNKLPAAIYQELLVHAK